MITTKDITRANVIVQEILKLQGEIKVMNDQAKLIANGEATCNLRIQILNTEEVKRREADRVKNNLDQDSFIQIGFITTGRIGFLEPKPEENSKQDGAACTQQFSEDIDDITTLEIFGVILKNKQTRIGNYVKILMELGFEIELKP